MKFTDGYWRKREGLTVFHPREVQNLRADAQSVTFFAPTRHVAFRGAELDAVTATVTVAPVADGILRVRIEGHRGGLPPRPEFNLNMVDHYHGVIDLGDRRATITAGALSAEVEGPDSFSIRFRHDRREVTSSLLKSVGLVDTDDGKSYVHEQLTIQPREQIYGLGERFGTTTKNGQSIDMWNEDGGTASDLAYKNVPFYLSSRGYGVLVNHPERVSFEVGSEVNTRVQFSVPGQSLEYFVIDGPTPKDVLRRYTELTGRAPNVPAWSYGLWLSTSFKTDYSEESLNGLLDEMQDNDLPISVLHFDCYWMRPSHWCDFVWDPARFPDPEGMLRRYHERGLRVCVWINPYVGQQAELWDEGMVKGYFLKRPDGSVRQWDHWQSGMAWVDFTNPDAKAWWQGHLRELLRQGVDCFKTDFGERVPTDVQWFDGSEPERMHNVYSRLYNEAVFEVLEQERGRGEALVFARSGTVGGQTMPVHWGGDSEPTFVSMHETLRGGLSLGLSGYAYWSHDMGGFEGTPDPAVFCRWFPFGMLSSHSRLHGSESFRTPWTYGPDAVTVARKYIRLKNRLMPYILRLQQEAVASGTPILRHMIIEFPNDPGSLHVDTQYMFGDSILVAPVFSATGDVDYYLPSANWTRLLSGQPVKAAGWHHEVHDLESLPLIVPPNTVIPFGAKASTWDYEYSQQLTIAVYGASEDMDRTVLLPDGEEIRVWVENGQVRAERDRNDREWSLLVVSPNGTSNSEGFPSGYSVSGQGENLSLNITE